MTQPSISGPMTISPDGDTVGVDGGSGATVLQGELWMPGDKSVSHRVAMLAALADGTTVIRGLSTGQDVANTVAAVAAMGATVTLGGTAGELEITGCSGHLSEPSDVVDVGNAGTGLRLLCGLWAGQDGLAVFAGDESLARRPVDRVIDPLRQMGAKIDARQGRYTPVAVRGGNLRGIEYTSPVASAGIKSALLLAGLSADGPTTVHEPRPTRRHTEELLAAFGADVVQDGEAGTVTVHPSALKAVHMQVPGDPSQAAFWVCAAAGVPGARVQVPNLYLGPLRSEFLDVLERMGADLDIDRETGTVTVTGRELHGVEVAEDGVVGLIDEFPALAVAAALAQGTTRVRGAAELRIKESDRIATIAAMLSSFGVTVEVLAEGFDIHGGARLRAGHVDAHGDHRIAMAAALLALNAQGVTTITGWSSVATSYPQFADHLEQVAGR